LIRLAEHEVHVAQQVALELSASLGMAETAVQRAERQVSDAAQAVVIDRGLQLAAEIEAAVAHLAALRAGLSGIDRLWVGNGPVRLPGKIVRCLGGVSSSSSGWDQRLKALVADAEASLP
jgi:hypothetical protein